MERMSEMMNPSTEFLNPSTEFYRGGADTEVKELVQDHTARQQESWDEK